MEYCSEGSLQQMLDKEKVFPETLVKAYTKQILGGLAYLHENKIVHRDLKCGNILVDHLGKLKLADFGCSKILSDSLSRVSQQGTPEFFSPELIRDEVPKGYEKSIDIWALGVVAWELACGRSLWHEPELGWVGTNRFQLMFKIANITSDPILPARLKLESLRDFVQCCLRVDPRQRHSVDQLLKHPFLTDKSFHNMRDEDILTPMESSETKEVVNLLTFGGSDMTGNDKCLESLQGEDSLCRMDSVVL